MASLPRSAALVEQLLRRARTVAIVGASPSPRRHSHAVVRYLKELGYDVLPIRPDRDDVAGVPSFSRLEDVPGPIDLVVLFRRPSAVPAHLREAAEHGVKAVWLQPGTASAEAERLSDALGLVAIRDRCIAEDCRHLLDREAGLPRKVTAHAGRSHSGRRAKTVKRQRAHGNARRGGGGRSGGGGVRSVLTEKKEAAPGPASRRGRARTRGR